jgi:hypothetical protein
LAVPIAVIVSLAFRIPQSEELEKEIKKVENNTEFKKRKIINKKS